jgi:hypothetical protein
MKITAILEVDQLTQVAKPTRYYCIVLVDRKTRVVSKLCTSVTYTFDGGRQEVMQPNIVSNKEQAESDLQHIDEAQYEAYLVPVIFPKFLTAMPEAASLIGSGEQTK